MPTTFVIIKYDIMQPNPLLIHPPHLWQQPQTNAYTLLAAFFNYISIDQHHFLTAKFIDAACRREYVQQTPGELLTWYETTQVLLYAANLINTHASGEDLDIGVEVSALPWPQQPHHLADYEVKDPYIAIEEIFEYKNPHQWQVELHAWLRAAFNADSILEEEGSPHETITLLYKLADALWLLWLGRKKESQDVGCRK
jgi:hypothetical protein